MTKAELYREVDRLRHQAVKLRHQAHELRAAATDCEHQALGLQVQADRMDPDDPVGRLAEEGVTG